MFVSATSPVVLCMNTDFVFKSLGIHYYIAFLLTSVVASKYSVTYAYVHRCEWKLKESTPATNNYVEKLRIFEAEILKTFL